MSNDPQGGLATVASIYDPLGFVAPFILRGKQILQQLCQDKAGWDEPLSDKLRYQWEQWLQDLPNLSNARMRRCYLPPSFTEVRNYELHHFSDASVAGYGQCSYLRAINTRGDVHCSFVMGKARVAPTKVTTIPRLELSAAVVAARASTMLRKELELDGLQEHFWMDSRVVLGYINNDAKHFHVFVANQIQRIKSLTDPEQWHFLHSEDNPADHASRGLMADQLISSNWFTGPDFLWKSWLSVGDGKVGEVRKGDPELKAVQVFSTKFVSHDLYLRKRWRQVQFLANESWTRWKREYLNLQQRQRWEKDKRNTRVNDIVMLQDNDAPRNQWRLARVAGFIPALMEGFERLSY